MVSGVGRMLAERGWAGLYSGSGTVDDSRIAAEGQTGAPQNRHSEKPAHATDAVGGGHGGYGGAWVRWVVGGGLGARTGFEGIVTGSRTGRVEGAGGEGGWCITALGSIKSCSATASWGEVHLGVSGRVWLSARWF